MCRYLFFLSLLIISPFANSQSADNRFIVEKNVEFMTGKYIRIKADSLMLLKTDSIIFSALNKKNKPEELSVYKWENKQYIGLIKDADTIIYINGFCRMGGKQDLTKSIVRIYDCGSCCFGALVNISQNKVEWFMPGINNWGIKSSGKNKKN